MNEGNQTPPPKEISLEKPLSTGRLDPDTLEPEKTLLTETIPSIDPETDPLLMANREERIRTVNEIVTNLEPKYRDVITLRFGLGGKQALSVAETAKLLGASEDSIRNWEHYGKNQIRNHPFYTKELFNISFDDDDL